MVTSKFGDFPTDIEFEMCLNASNLFLGGVIVSIDQCLTIADRVMFPPRLPHEPGDDILYMARPQTRREQHHHSKQ